MVPKPPGEISGPVRSVGRSRAHRVDAWRFDWDSLHTEFEISAGNLAGAINVVNICLEKGM